MIRNFVCAKIEHIGEHPRLGSNQTIPKDLVIKSGYCNFTVDPTNEFSVSNNFIFDTSTLYQDWYYNSTTQTFQKTVP